MPRPAPIDVPVFYHNYVSLVQEDDLQNALAIYPPAMLSFLSDIPAGRWSYRYAAGKWSVSDLVQHLIDAERIFCYRALRFARRDTTELPGFDENTFASNAGAERREKDDLLQELSAVQQATAALFRSFNEDQLSATGIANNVRISVNAIGFVIVGHMLHHRRVLEERYFANYVAASGGEL